MPLHMTEDPSRRLEALNLDVAEAIVLRGGKSVLWDLDVVNTAAGRASIRRIALLAA
jgi:hypothetical protein